MKIGKLSQIFQAGARRDCRPPFLAAAWLAAAALLPACESFGGDGDSAGAQAPAFDVIIRNGVIYDGSGGEGYAGDIAVQGDRIVSIGDLSERSATLEIDARGAAVSPGFVNMLSWASLSLPHDNRAVSDLMQGVTLEVFGEGWSPGPLTELGRASQLRFFPDLEPYMDEWSGFGEGMQWLEDRGMSPNIASFVGHATVRMNHLGLEDCAPTADELEAMRADVRQSMLDGAVGLGTSLIYAPAFYADTAELASLAEVAGRYNGLYSSHIRSEANRLLESIDELIHIAEQADVPANIWHFKAAGLDNWPKLAEAIAKIEGARARGVSITTDIYPYTAGATALTATTPPWAQDGGLKALIRRAKDPEIRKRIIEEMRTPTDEWEQLLSLAGGGEGVMFLHFRDKKFEPFLGKTLAEVAALRGESEEDAILNLLTEDESDIHSAFFMMSDENLAMKMALPWAGFNSDAEAPAPEGDFLKRSFHPRAYGAFARVLSEHVRERGHITLGEAIRRLTSHSTELLGLEGRGRLKTGYYADIVIFDPETIRDNATFQNPQQLATGVSHVFVNGVAVVRDGAHTGATPGRFLRGPGYAPE